MNRHLVIGVLVVGLICGIFCGGVAASETVDDSTKTEPESADSLAPSQPTEVIMFAPEKSLREFLDVSDSTNTEARLIQNPTAALFKSLVIPGWGQVGNRSYFKAVFYGGLECLLVGAALNYRSQSNDAWDDYSNATDSLERNRLYNIYDDRKTKRNRYTWFAALTIFISMFDAYVDAHLSGFPLKGESQAIELEIGPTPAYTVGASVKLSF